MRRESAGTFALTSLTTAPTAAALKLRIEYKHSVKLVLAEADDRGEKIIHIALYAIPCARAAPKFDVYQFFISNESNQPTYKEDTVLQTFSEIISWWRASVRQREREREREGGGGGGKEGVNVDNACAGMYHTRIDCCVFA